MAFSWLRSHCCTVIANTTSPEDGTEQGQKVLFCACLRQITQLSSCFLYCFPPVLAAPECQHIRGPLWSCEHQRSGAASRIHLLDEASHIAHLPFGHGAHTYLSLYPRTTFWMRMTLSVMALSLSISSSMSWWSCGRKQHSTNVSGSPSA